jgi:hypothetical protein
MTPAAVVVLAHVGHWAVDLAIYLGPAVVILALLKLGDRRREAAEADPPEADPVSD